MIQIVCDSIQQINVEFENLSEDEIRSLSDEEIQELVESVCLGAYDNKYGSASSNYHVKEKYEVLKDEEPIRYFEVDYE